MIQVVGEYYLSSPTQQWKEDIKDKENSVMKKEKRASGRDGCVLVTSGMLRIIKPQLEILHARRPRDPSILTLDARIRPMTR